MQISAFGLDRHITDQVLAQAAIIHQLDDVPMRVNGERILRDMLEKLDAGVRRTASWAQAEVRKVDPALTLRWDFDFHRYVLDRFVVERKCFSTVCQWTEELTLETVSDLVQALRAGDMQRAASPEDYMREKRKRSEEIRTANSQRGEAKVLAAIDSLPEKSVTQFIQAERALRTGERVFATGEDAKSLERMAKASKKSPPPPSGSMIPATHPKLHRRRPR